MSMLLAGLYESAVNFKVRILLALLGQVINKHLRMNTSINLESLTEMPEQLGWAKCLHKKKIDIDSLKFVSAIFIKFLFFH